MTKNTCAHFRRRVRTYVHVKRGSWEPKICTSLCNHTLPMTTTHIPAETHTLHSISGGVNLLTPNDSYMGRTAPLTSKRCILYIYSTNIGTEYFKHALYSPFFFSSKCSIFHNANLFGTCITVIPRLTKIIRSGITFVSRNLR